MTQELPVVHTLGIAVQNLQMLPHSRISWYMQIVSYCNRTELVCHLEYINLNIAQGSVESKELSITCYK